MQVYRVIESLLVVNGRLIMTLSCKDQQIFPIGYFRNRPFLTNKAGQNIYRCPQCEARAARSGEPGGGAA